jgi:hypothetical protein
MGFRDASTRDVPLVADHKRIVFIGDLFTEGLGVPYQKTFVGRFASAFPDLDVLNAAAESYSASIYYEKLKYFLDVGFRFDEAIVYIDISDITFVSVLANETSRGGGVPSKPRHGFSNAFSKIA